MNNLPYIICADDVQTNQIAIKEMLQEHFSLKCTSNGIECLESISEKRPDLILVGKSMPLNDDSQACINLREKEQYKEIPIISLFSEAPVTESKNGFKADLYLADPFDKQRLLSSIESLLIQLDPDESSCK